jgi:membrane protein implicated in regulation of membrane protease activity
MAMRPTKADAALKAGEKPEGLRLSAVEIIAGALSLVWLAAAALFFLILPTETEGGGFDTMGFVMTLLAVFLPIAVIWVAAIAMRSARIVREESRRLQAAIDAMRQTYVADRQARGAGGMDPTVEKKLNLGATRPGCHASCPRAQARTGRRPADPCPWHQRRGHDPADPAVRSCARAELSRHPG